MSNVDRYDFEDYGTLESGGRYVKYEDYIALQAERDQLATENATLKKAEPAPFSKLMMEALDAYQSGADDVPELAMLSAYTKLGDGIKTPATDAWQREQMAKGVDAFGQYHNFSEKLFIQKEAKKFAEKLRNGEAV
ncbi:hypothetical protein [Pseudescherichia sp.]|uniref:hypothetical protein n=1 Tax=Pseudescherichia sp. TaxID=2055881 RepID=UPI00289C038B|nr:hypothetical protein [Pseudescherichia sp.]